VTQIYDYIFFFKPVAAFLAWTATPNTERYSCKSSWRFSLSFLQSDMPQRLLRSVFLTTTCYSYFKCSKEKGFPGQDCAHFQPSTYSWLGYIHLSLCQSHNAMKNSSTWHLSPTNPLPAQLFLCQTKQTKLCGAPLQGVRDATDTLHSLI